MRRYLLAFISCCLLGAAFAQEEREPEIHSPVIRVSSNNLYGKILDDKTKKGVEAVSVQLLASNTADGARKDSLVSATMTKPNGDFYFSNLPAADSFTLLITAVGYAHRTESISFDRQNRRSNSGAVNKDLGNIYLEPEAQTLTGVVVTAQRPALEMGIDRKVFHVEKNLTAAGGTALDVMKGIPSVSVDVEGNVQLRNAAPQIFVDGRPTILTLDQIPSDNIERIELITNPSAKFDAASSAGIINVVLKKNKRVGFNGVATVGAGHPSILNGNLNLNIRQGNFNFFVSGGYNQSGGRAKSRALRQNRKDGVLQNYFNQYSLNDRMRRFGSLRFGVDYFLDNRNTISLSQGLVRGRFSNDENQDQEYLNTSKILERYGERFSENKSGFRRYSTELYYGHKFPEMGKELSASINYNYGNGENNTNILNTYFYPDGSEYADPARVRNEGENNSDQVTFQLDFVDPNGDNSKLETGIRTYLNDYNSLFSAFALTNGSAIKLPLSNHVQYQELVNAFYITYSNKIKTFSYQAGLRAEHSRFDGELIDSARKFGYEYPNTLSRIFDAVFPSLFLTKQWSDDIETQVNYSRRIRRPSFWQLNPFVSINDPVNISQGNPQLRPEFTNSLEFNYSQRYPKGNFLGVIYYRNNQSDITRYSDTITSKQYEQLNNAAVDPNAILNTFINAQATNRLGAEFTLQHKLGTNFDVTPTVNLQYRKVKAQVNDLNLSNEGFNWEAKLIANYKITTQQPSFFNNLGFQLIGEYESPEVIPQGRRLEQYSLDFALRKDFLENNRASLTFSVNDVFNTNRFGTIYDTENFYQDSYRRWNVRTLRINFTYKFGDTDFKLFQRNQERNDDDDR